MLDDYNTFFENDNNREQFALICCELLKSTFINKMVVSSDGGLILNEKYIFIKSNQDLFEEYFELSGWQLNINNSRGVAYIKNIYGKNKTRFRQNITIVALILRIIYDRKKEEASGSDNVIIRAKDIIRELINTDKINKKPADKEMQDILRILENSNIICRIKKEENFLENVYIIMPSITIAVSDERITEIHRNMFEEDTDETN